MKSRLIILLIIMAYTFQLNAQKFNNYFSFEPSYSINFSRTSLDRDKVPSTGYGLFLYQKEIPRKIYSGKSFGINLFFPFWKKWQFGTGILYEHKGQSSSITHSTHNPEVKLRHSFILESYQIPIVARFFPGKKLGAFHQHYFTEWIADVYSKFTAQQYEFDPKYGKQESSYEMLYYRSKHMDNFKAHLKENLIRIGIGVGFGLSFEKLEFITLKSFVSARYYTNLLNKKIDFAIQGDGVLINAGISAGFKIKK